MEQLTIRWTASPAQPRLLLLLLLLLLDSQAPAAAGSGLEGGGGTRQAAEGLISIRNGAWRVDGVEPGARAQQW